MKLFLYHVVEAMVLVVLWFAYTGDIVKSPWYAVLVMAVGIFTGAIASLLVLLIHHHYEDS
jgi:hypothetical protein